MNERSARRLLVLLLVAFVGLGMTYSLAIPVFEAPDEASHLAVVRYFATHRALPPEVVPDHPPATGAEVAQSLAYHDPPLYYAPPLYHALGALLTAWMDADAAHPMSDLPRLVVPSPSWEAGWAPQPDTDPLNKNVYAHRAAEETLARSGTVRAAFALRMLSLALGATTVLCACALARTLWPDRRVLALGAAAIVALNPQFIAVSSGVTNDNLLNALFSLCLVLLVRSMRDGASWWRWSGLGALVGLALLTKQSALLLLPVGLLAIGQQHSTAPRRWSLFIVHCSFFILPALAVSGWWYVRNARLYGDPLGFAPHFGGQTGLSHFGLDAVLMAARSYWAAFGWTLVLVEPGVYVVVGLVALAALAGVGMAVWPGGPFWREPVITRRGLALLGTALVLNALSLVRWAVATGAPYGRLLFPTIAAAGVLVAWGLAQWTRRKAARWALVGLTGLAFAFAVLVPWRYLRPAFASPRLPDGLPGTAQPVGIAFQNGVELAGYKALARDLRPGHEVRLTLYWRALLSPGQRYRTWVQLGPQDAMRYVAGCDTWLGGTLYPSDLWQAGDTVRQTFRLAIPDQVPAPGLYWVRAGMTDEAGTRIPLADGSGDMAVLGPWRMLAAGPAPEPVCAADYRLGETIRLLGYDLQHTDGTLQATLHWQATRAPGADYTVFVHLLDAGGNPLGQHDGPPREGAYPTSWWLPNQVVVDRHTIQLTKPLTGAARLLVGLYDAATLVRLPAYDGQGQRLAGDAIPLAEITAQGDSPCASD